MIDYSKRLGTSNLSDRSLSITKHDREVRVSTTPKYKRQKSNTPRASMKQFKVLNKIIDNKLRSSYNITSKEMQPDKSNTMLTLTQDDSNWRINQRKESPNNGANNFEHQAMQQEGLKDQLKKNKKNTARKRKPTQIALEDRLKFHV